MKIAIAGKAGSGKSTAANHLVAEYGFRKMALADKLKAICALHKEIYDNFDKDWCDHQDLVRHVGDLFPEFSVGNSIAIVSELWETFVSRTPVDGKDRALLQYVGTDILRAYNPTVWVDYLVRAVGTGNVVVDDVRFKNEFHTLKDNGWTMVQCAVPNDVRASRLEEYYGRALTEEEANHSSECDLDDLPTCEWDWILNTAGSMETERAQVDELIDYLIRKQG